jgi:hypothetical protein
VAISGLHRPASFQAIGPVKGRPVLLDDTCYLLPCNQATEAAVLTALYNHQLSLGLIEALSFPGAKRPVTKGLLQRLDISAILGRADRVALVARAGAILAEQPGQWIDDSTAITDQVERLIRQFEDTATRQSHLR